MKLYLATMLVGGGAVSNARTGIAAHFILAPACAIVFTLFPRFFAIQNDGQSGSAHAEAQWPTPVFRFVRQPLLLLLTCSALLSVVWGFSLTADSLSFYGNLLPPALGMALGLPVGLLLFSRTVPPGRQGLMLSLAVASGELIWIILLPVFSAIFSASGADASLSGPVTLGMALHIFTTLCLFQAGAALCFAASLILDGSGTGDRCLNAGPCGWPDRQDVSLSPVRAGLALLFIAGLCFFVLFGMTFLESSPRTFVNLVSPGNLHYFLLVSAPLAGGALDRSGTVTFETTRSSRRGLPMLLGALALAALSAPLLWFLRDGLLSGNLAGALLGFMNLARQALLLTLYVLIFRLAGMSRWFLPLVTLAYALHLAQYPSAALGRAVIASGGRNVWIAAEFCLALGFALSLGVFYVWLNRHPQLAALPEPEKQQPVPDEITPLRLVNEAKQRAFAAAFDFTEREEEILKGILSGLDNTVMAANLNRERTVRHHIGGLLKKTGVSNRKRLQHCYTSWHA